MVTVSKARRGALLAGLAALGLAAPAAAQSAAEPSAQPAAPAAAAAAPAPAATTPAPAAAAAPAAAPAPWQIRFAAGGEVGATAFGIGDIGFRKGAFSIQLFTDTLDVRYAPESQRGRWFVGARIEALAAGLMLSPWRAGAPDLSQALLSGYGELDGGWVAYLPASFYIGAQAAARLYLFFPRPETTIAVPGPTPVFTTELVAGRYTSTSHIWIRAGLDAQPSVASPHIALEAVARPDTVWAPRLELRAAWARNQDRITRTRLGGMNPYVVPLGGAGWAEWWVESYVATRGGLSVRAPLPKGHSLEGAILSDVAVFDGGFVQGFALQGRWRYGRYSAEASIGYAPWIQRQEGVSRVAFFALFGGDWADLRRRKPR